MNFTLQMQDGISTRSFAAARMLAPLSLALLAACGGGGGGGTPDGGTQNSTAATALAANSVFAGSVSGLGSIVVNGVRFETVGAQVLDADDPYGTSAYTDPVKLGMTVAVEGTADESTGSGSATRIRIDGGIRGQVGAVDTAAGTLTVNGQTVKINASTLISGASGPAAIAAATWVEIYGLAQTDGSFLATRIEVYASKPQLDASYPNATTYPLSLRGIVAAASAGSFTLPDGKNGYLSVSYSAANVVPAGTSIAAGTSVRVLATAAPAGNGPVVAAKVLVLNPSTLLGAAASASAVKLKGVVDSVGAGSIVVSGTTVDISAAAKPALAIAKNQVVEVGGTMNNGILVASKVSFEDRQASYTAQPGAASSTVDYQQELYGLISAYDATRNTFVVQGVTVQANTATGFELGYNKLANDVYVEVKGALQNGVLVATKIEVKGVTASAATSVASGGASDTTNDSALSKSSGGDSFEFFGTLTCSSYPSACSINGGANSVNTNLAAAVWEKGAYAANSYVEAKGVLDKAGVFQVAKIEVKH